MKVKKPLNIPDNAFNRAIVKNAKFYISTFLVIFFSVILISIFYIKSESDRFVFTHSIDKVMLYDEVLTNSTRLAAFSGSTEWESLYLATEEKLDNEIKILLEHTDIDGRHFINQISAANIALLADEKRVFSLVRKGKLKQAQKLIKSKTYLQNKNLYRLGFENYIKYQNLELSSKHSNVKLFSAFLTLLGFAFMVFSIIVFRLLPKIIHSLRIKNEESKVEIQQLNQFIAASPVSIAIFDREIKYLACSKKWLSDYSLENAKLIGRSHYEVFDDISDEWKEIHQRVVQGETLSCDGDYFQLNDGSDFWLNWVVTPWYDQNNEVGGIVMSTENVTEKKLAERKILHQSKLASMGAMIATIAHELKNPLTIIRGGANLIDSKLNREEVDLNSISKLNGNNILATDRIMAILEKLRIDSRNDIDDRDDYLSLNQLLLENIQFNEILLNKEKVNFEYELGVDDDIVFGNSGEISQVFVNLMSNARDAIRDQKDRVIRVRSRLMKDRVRVSIFDNGPGIPDEFKDKIFERFFTTKDADMGTGIGLDLVASIIKRHGGEINFEQTALGTTFYFDLPLASSQEDKKAA